MHLTVNTVHKFSVSKAHKTQLRLSQKIITEDCLPKKINRVAGIDVAYAGERAAGAVAVLDYGSLELLEYQTVTCKVKFPYIPTLLAFREIPPSVASIKKLSLQPDVLLVDGQGVAHPYSCGFASHLGLVIGKPTIGVAKSKLVGVPKTVEGQVLLFQKNQIRGAVINTKEDAKPVYVSVGHLVSLQTAVRIVKHCTRNSRVPEPLLHAHKIATEEKRKIQDEHKTL
jgi:deoxyribonuclease V